MLSPLKAPAPHVVAARIEGEIGTDDINQALSLLESGLEKNRRINLFFDVREMKGITPVAFFMDLAYSLKNLGRLYRFQQLALVTDNPNFEKVVAWEDKLFKNLEIKTFPSSGYDEAVAWVERRPELPPPGFQVEQHETHLVVRLGDELSGHDVTQVADLIHDHYEKHGPVRMLITLDKVPKLGPGYLYEKLRQFNLVGLLDRYAVSGPAALKAAVGAANPVMRAHLKYFEPGQEENAIIWLLDETPTAELLPEYRPDRFSFRLSGKITKREVEALYQALLPRLQEENGLDVLLEIPYEDGITLGAVFKALKLGVQNFSKLTHGVRRMAVVTDSRFLSKASELENYLTSSIEERPFTFAERDRAVAWLSEGRPALTAPLSSDEAQELV